MNDIKDNMDKPWEWTHVQCNPNITIEFLDFIKNNKDVRKMTINISENIGRNKLPLKYRYYKMMLREIN